MRKKIFLKFLLFCFIILTSCNGEKQKKPFNDDFFALINTKKSKFIVNHGFVYCFSGDIKNISNSIFESAVVSVDVEFILENGVTIQEKDYSNGMFKPLRIYKFWKPNEINTLQHLDGEPLKSESIPKEYLDYPIKRVNAVINFNVEDKINQLSGVKSYDMDITDLWKQLKNK